MNIENEKQPEVNKKKNRNISFYDAWSPYFSASVHGVIDKLKNIKCIMDQSTNVLPYIKWFSQIS